MMIDAKVFLGKVNMAGKYPVIFQVISKSFTKEKDLNIAIRKEHWNKGTNRVTEKDSMYLQKNSVIEYTFMRFNEFRTRMTVKGLMVTPEIIDDFLEYREINFDVDDISFNEYMDANIENSRIRDKLSPFTLQTRRRAVRYFNEFNPNVQLRELKSELLLKYWDWLKNVKKLHRNTIIDNVAVLKQIYYYGLMNDPVIQKRELAQNPFKLISMTKTKDTEVRAFTYKEFKRIDDLKDIIKEQPESTYITWMMLRFAIRTSFRISDVRTFQAKHVREIDYGKVIIKRPVKFKASMYHISIRDINRVFQDNVLSEILKVYYNDRMPLDTLIFPKVLRSDFEAALRWIARKAKIEYFTFHIARKTFVTYLLGRNVRVKKVMFAGGWASSRVLSRYLDVTDEFMWRM